jgi:hypothetical protein
MIVSDSVVSSNDGGIMACCEGSNNVMVRATVVANNRAWSVISDFGAIVRVTKSAITGNGYAMIGSAGVLDTCGDNNVDGNGSDVNQAQPIVMH